ncbi:hypothetical protein HWV62_22159 [Athelia sp. TMB]|nr:hypothetical protein HWV62_22159 [Athelia sp. TMB]
MDADVVAMLMEGSVVSLLNELIVHRDLAASRGEIGMIGETARGLDALRGTIVQQQRATRALEQALDSAQKRAGEQEDKIQQLLRDGKVAEMKFEREIEKHRKRAKYLTKQISERDDRIADLQGDVYDATVTIGRHNALSKAVTCLRRPFVHLPQEIVHAILAQAVCPMAFLDPTIHPGINSALSLDLQTRVSFGLVCKAWRPIGLALMYECIFILRIGQILALKEVLLSDNSRGELVKSIDVSCIVPEGDHPPEIYLELLNIFQHCRKIRSVTFGSVTPWNPYCLKIRGDIALVEEPGTTHTSVEAILPLVSNAAHMGSLVECCRNLTYLALWIGSSMDEKLSVVAFDALETLRLTIDCEDFAIYRAMSESWSLPCLKNLILTETSVWRSDTNAGSNDSYADSEDDKNSEEAMKHRESMLAKIGPGLRYLHMRPMRPCIEAEDEREIYGVDMQKLLDYCPGLEHLAISPNCIAGWPSLSHPNIKWIDVWNLESGINDDADAYAEGGDLNCFNPADFPHLRGTRRLDSRPEGLPSYIDWPSLLPPWTELEDTGRLHILLGIIVRQTASAIYRSDTIDIDWEQELVLDFEAARYHSSSDSSYAPSEESSSNDSDANANSDADST